MTTPAAALSLQQRIHAGEIRAGVIGLGYVGLPLAVEFAGAGYEVVGLDIDPRKVETISAGRSYIPDVPDADVAKLVAAGRLRATTDFSVIARLDTVNICVPTPLRKTKDPDVSYMVAAVSAVATHLHPGMLVILESTTYPGTTEELARPLLEAGGLKVGRDFFLAFSPERVDPGNPHFRTANVPKVVGGTTQLCTALARTLYERAIERVVTVGSTQAAEMVKLLENTFRAVNIGLVNEVAMMCDTLGIDVWEVVDAAATKPFGFMPFYPGPGLGGHCIPIDPFYLSWKARQSGFEARFIQLAGEINGQMPDYVVSKAVDALNEQRKSVNGSRALVLGVAYKRDVDDVRESPALDVMKRLHDKGAEVAYSDPHVPFLTAEAWHGPHALQSVELDRETLERFDTVVITTDHSAFDYDLILQYSRSIVDTRNALRAATRAAPDVIRLGASGTIRPSAIAA
ncbi:MAG TPA: nucleotide sugar dehydrogenase [Vicinamibacterales bacterium]|nr:nucleotide sugar dehydrogenase [Vicinamibacterales bacterium]